MRAKVDNVTRMQTTIRYSEEVRQEWQEKMEERLTMQVLAEAEADAETEHGAAEHDMNGRVVEDDQTSTTSEYTFVGDGP